MKLEKKDITKKTKIVLGVLLLTSFFLTISYLTTIVFGWVGPTQNPPYGNVSFKNSCENVFNEWCSGLGEVCYVVSEDGNGGSVVPECVSFKEDGSIDPPQFIPNVEGDTVYTQVLSGSLGSLSSFTGIILGVQKQLVEVSFGSNIPFGYFPESLDGVDFYDGDYVAGMIVFKTPGTYSITPVEADQVEVLVVAGGGGGRNKMGGGGGAGGLLYEVEFSITTSPITVTVGAGGVYDYYTIANNRGGNSRFSTLIAIGGGEGGSFGTPASDGYGSGGGGGGHNTVKVGGNSVIGQGFSGGTVYSTYIGGGGGGAGGSGGDTTGGITSGLGGKGGDGLEYFGFWYAGGGGGGGSGELLPSGGGGRGGGGRGGTISSGHGYYGVANTGGGGGGGEGSSGGGGSGGSGIVIVRWGGYSKNYDPTYDSVWY